MTRPLPAVAGRFTPEQVRAAARRGDLGHVPTTRIVAIENTHNASGGRVWPLAEVEAMAETCRELDLMLHLDGARLFNAAVASGVAPSAIAGHADTVTICFSKGLGCPLGAIVAGSAERMVQARRFKHQFGGAMRQAGIVAAACVYALDHNVDRLAEDHARARRLARGARTRPACRSISSASRRTSSSSTSGRWASTPGDATERLLGRRRAASPGTLHPGVLRAVTHLGIGDEDIDRAIEAIPPRARGRSAIASDEERHGDDHVEQDQRGAVSPARLAGPTKNAPTTSADVPSAAISTGLKAKASGSIAHESNATAGIRKTATWAPDESAISAAEPHLAAVRDDDRPAVLGRVADDRHDHGGDEEVGQVRLLRECLDRADEDLRDQRGDHRRSGEHADRDSTTPRLLRPPRTPRACARCRLSCHHVTPT